MKYYSDCFVIGRHNPSKVGGGYRVLNDYNQVVSEETIYKYGFTNNEGELLGVQKALEIAQERDVVSTDSKVVMSWVRSGNPKARPDLKYISQQCKRLVVQKNIRLIWEGRENNLAGIYNEEQQLKHRRR